MKVFFTILSESTMHDSRTVTEMVKTKIIAHPIFNHFGVKKLSFWMDNAPNHFRTFETCALFADLSDNYTVSSNYFCEYHGKSECDRHFGFMSRAYTDFCSRVINDDVTTTGDYLSMYKNAIMQNNGVLINPNGGFLDELKVGEKEAGGLNVVATTFLFSGVAESITQARTLPAKELLKTSKEGVCSPYVQRITKVDDSLKFVLTNYYNFEFTDKTICARLTSDLPAPKSTTVPYFIVEKLIEKYKVKFAPSETSTKEKYKVLKKSWRTYTSHLEDRNYAP